MERILRWFFGLSGSEEHGPRDSITTTFKGNKYYSLAREVIQNSLDAVLDRTKPVRVAFSIFELERETLPGLFDLAVTIRRCRDFYADTPAFTKFCDRALNLLSGGVLKCLRIADFNTKGLEYGKGKTPFYAFMQAVGYTLKPSTGAGGSFGFGKGAYYAASTLRTLIVSSVYGKGNFIFQGKSRLTTHLDDDGNKKDYTGLFGFDQHSPVEDRAAVPPELVREERGTDVIIVGFDDDEHTWEDSLIKSVLNNFWMAIWESKLVVEVGDIVIDKNSLETIIEKYYSESGSDGRANEPETWNPYPYFKAVKYQGGPNNYVFEKNLPTLGSVRMYMFVKENLPNRTVYMRSPKMTVYKRTNNRGSNYVAVFECDDELGNEILREMENPEHNEWRKNNYLDNDKPHPDAVKAETEIREFVNECLDKLRSQNAGAKQKIMGLEQYLTIPEDLLPDEEGLGQNGVSGVEVTDEADKNETAVETVVKTVEPSAISLKAKKKVTVAQQGTGTTREGPEVILTGSSGGNGEGGPGEPGAEPGSHETRGSTNGNSQIKKPLKLRYRVLAQKSGAGEIIHLVKLFSEIPAVAEVEFYAGVDNDTGSGDDSLAIKTAHRDGQEIGITQNKITNLTLNKGENLLLVEFDSDQKHSLRIKSYEI